MDAPESPMMERSNLQKLDTLLLRFRSPNPLSQTADNFTKQEEGKERKE